MQCTFCSGTGEIPEQFVTLYRAWDALHTAVQSVNMPPNVLRHVRRTQDMLTQQARTLHIDFDTSVALIRQEVDEIRDLIVARFDVSREQAEEDLLQLIDQFEEIGAITDAPTRDG